MSKKIIKYLKNSIDEKGNYCYSLPDDLIKMEKLEKETGKNYFTIQLFAIRVKEIYKLLEDNNNGK